MATGVLIVKCAAGVEMAVAMIRFMAQVLASVVVAGAQHLIVMIAPMGFTVTNVYRALKIVATEHAVVAYLALARVPAMTDLPARKKSRARRACLGPSAPTVFPVLAT